MYDYIEIMPIDNNKFMIDKGEVNDAEELRDINRRLVKAAEENWKNTSSNWRCAFFR